MGSKKAPTGALEGSYQSLDFHPYEERNLGDDAFARAVMLGMKPISRYKNYVVGAPHDSISSRRLGVHFNRLPYFNRDVWYAAAKELYEMFSKVKDADQTNFLHRNAELIIRETGLEIDPRTQAETHVHYAAHYMYDTTAVVLSAIQALVFGRIEGFSHSPRASAALKFSVINSMLSVLKGMPINRKYIEYCLGQMKLLADRNDKSLLMSVPLWLPRNMSHFMDIPNVVATYAEEDTTDSMVASAMRHLMMEELHPASTSKLEMFGSMGGAKSIASDALTAPLFADFIVPMGIARNDLESGNYPIGVFGQTTDNYIRKFIDMLAHDIACVKRRYAQNPNFQMNITSSQNKIADLWYTMGLVDDRLKSEDIAKWADGISTAPVDLEDYARANWGKHSEMVKPALISKWESTGVFTGDVLAVSGRLDRANILGVAEFDSPADSHLMSSAHDLVTANAGASNFANVLQNYYPFAALVRSDVLGDWDDFRDLRYAGFFTGQVNNLHGALESFNAAKWAEIARVAGDFGMVNVPMTRGTVMRMAYAQLSPATPRFINENQAGKLVDKTAAQDGVYTHSEMLQAGVFMPMELVTPVIDPYDPYQHGIFEIVDLIEPTKANELSGILAQADVTTDITAGTLTAINDTIDGFITDGAFDQDMNVLSSASVTEKLLPAIGLSMVFTGDLFNRAITTHLLRADIFRCAMGRHYEARALATDASDDPMKSILPISPFRQPAGLDFISFPLAGLDLALPTYYGVRKTGKIVNSCKGVTITFGAVSDLVEYDPDSFTGSLIDRVSGINDNTDPVFSISDFWISLLFPLLMPSSTRMSTETSDGMFFAFKDANLVSVKGLPLTGKIAPAKAQDSPKRVGILREDRPKRDFKKRDSRGKSFERDTARKDFGSKDRRNPSRDDSVTENFPEATIGVKDVESSAVAFPIKDSTDEKKTFDTKRNRPRR